MNSLLFQGKNFVPKLNIWKSGDSLLNCAHSDSKDRQLSKLSPELPQSNSVRWVLGIGPKSGRTSGCRVKSQFRKTSHATGLT